MTLRWSNGSSVVMSEVPSAVGGADGAPHPRRSAALDVEGQRGRGSGESAIGEQIENDTTSPAPPLPPCLRPTAADDNLVDAQVRQERRRVIRIPAPPHNESVAVVGARASRSWMSARCWNEELDVVSIQGAYEHLRCKHV